MQPAGSIYIVLIYFHLMFPFADFKRKLNLLALFAELVFLFVERAATTVVKYLMERTGDKALRSKAALRRLNYCPVR